MEQLWFIFSRFSAKDSFMLTLNFVPLNPDMSRGRSHSGSHIAEMTGSFTQQCAGVDCKDVYIRAHNSKAGVLDGITLVLGDDTFII